MLLVNELVTQHVNGILQDVNLNNKLKLSGMDILSKEFDDRPSPPPCKTSTWAMSNYQAVNGYQACQQYPEGRQSKHWIGYQIFQL